MIGGRVDEIMTMGYTCTAQHSTVLHKTVHLWSPAPFFGFKYVISAYLKG